MQDNEHYFLDVSLNEVNHKFSQHVFYTGIHTLRLRIEPDATQSKGRTLEAFW